MIHLDPLTPDEAATLALVLLAQARKLEAEIANADSAMAKHVAVGPETLRRWTHEALLFRRMANSIGAQIKTPRAAQNAGQNTGLTEK